MGADPNGVRHPSARREGRNYRRDNAGDERRGLRPSAARDPAQCALGRSDGHGERNASIETRCARRGGDSPKTSRSPQTARSHAARPCTDRLRREPKLNRSMIASAISRPTPASSISSATFKSCGTTSKSPTIPCWSIGRNINPGYRWTAKNNPDGFVHGGVEQQNPAGCGSCRRPPDGASSDSQPDLQKRR